MASSVLCTTSSSGWCCLLMDHPCVLFGWVSILDMNLSQFGVGEKTAGWLGFGASMAGIAAGISLSM